VDTSWSGQSQLILDHMRRRAAKGRDAGHERYFVDVVRDQDHDFMSVSA